jgi:hypothetical protein
MNPRILVLLGVLALGAGCSTWRPQGLAPEAILAREQPSQMRIAGGPEGPVVFRHARVEGDSLVGEVRHARTAIALDDVTRVEVRRHDPTAARILAPLVVVVATVGAIFVGAAASY